MSSSPSASSYLQHRIKCKFTGVTVAVLEIQVTAGTIPYLSHWNECVAMHSLFSLPTSKLLDFTHNEWTRLANQASIAPYEAETLCVGYVAILHKMGSIKQDAPGLPTLDTVHSTISKLFHLVYWKHRLESLRFKFPTLHLSHFNKNLDFSNIADYLNLCFDVKRDYETAVIEAVEKEKIETARKAMLALNREWVTPVSKKVLWSWVKAHIPDKYQADSAGWLATLFLGKSSAIINFDWDELELAREIIESSCPLGSSILRQVRQRLTEIETIWKDHNDSFSIDLDNFAPTAKLYVNGVAVLAPDPGEAPQASNFTNKAAYYVAHAKWSIAKRAFDKRTTGETL